MKKTGSDSPHWGGVGEISGQLYSKIRRDAVRRGILFNVNLEHLWSIFLKQNSRCALTGWELKFATCSRAEQDIERTASLDRINSDLGYVRGNLRWVHKSANRIKGDLSDHDLFKVVGAIAAHHDLVKKKRAKKPKEKK